MTRKDLETGTQVSFTAADKVSLLVKALQNQTIGIIGRQFIAATVNAQTASAMQNLTNADLASVAAFIGVQATATVKYMHLAYDINGNNVTNYYLGLVVQIDRVPNNGQDIANAIHASPLGYITDQFASYGYEAYIIGNPPVGTYHFSQQITAMTSDSIQEKELIDAYGSIEAAKQHLMNLFIANAQAKFQQAYSEQGANVTVISAEILNCDLIKTAVYGSLYPTYKLTVKIDLTLDSDIPFQNSPIIPLVIIAIFAGIALVVGAYVGIPALFKWLESMTTKEVVSTQKTYGWQLNPNTGLYEWVLTDERTETITEPDLGGMGSLGIIIAALGVGAILLFAFMSKARSKGSG